jgi:D-glycero-beta-D-manno-heptose 1-phosphate adenylyltransferase
MSWEERYQEKVISPEDIEEYVSALKKEGKSVVTLNGSFDLMHAGHLHLLYEASRVGDVLIAGLNTDASIRRYKSADRPIVALQYRLQMMAAISFVDKVTWFDEDDPCALLEKIQPDIHVNGAEYGEECVEAAVVKKHGGTIHLVPRIPSLSTTELVHKIQSLQEG